MRIDEAVDALPVPAIGSELYDLCVELFPICRSITGDGVRQTLEVVSRHVPLDVHEVPSGTSVLDWTVPNEWNVRDAYVSGPSGDRVIDFQRSNLHLLGYSTPVRTTLPLDELRKHLITLPDRPDRIPYRTSYYQEAWGFCLSEDELQQLPDGDYEVVIDSSLDEGSLTYGEHLIEGRTKDEVLLTTHVCHPSLANDNLSGITVLALLGRALAALDLRYSYRLLFIPGTIGSITWLARNEGRVPVIKHGLVITGVGDPGAYTYKRSRQGAAEIDRAAGHVLQSSGDAHRLIDFTPYGYDERQFCSPGFDMPVGRFGRSAHNEYPEYHTSADDLDLVKPQHLAESFATILRLVEVLEGNAAYVNLSPKGEPQLGRRGLYSAIGGQIDKASVELALLWVLNQSDGSCTLLDIAERAELPFRAVRRAADALLEHGLLEEVAGPS
jgi:aminopeptidase-like protein